MSDVSVLLGKILTKIDRVGNDELIFHTADGKCYKMFHDQQCCECVEIEDICGNLENLIGHPVLMAEETSNSTDQPSVNAEYVENYTWTFYRFGTIRGSVTIRWYGSSNGYYSESVDFVEIERPEE